MWMVFGPHQECLDIFKEYSTTRGKNVVITGYPSCEAFFEDKKSNPWKSDVFSPILGGASPSHYQSAYYKELFYDIMCFLN